MNPTQTPVSENAPLGATQQGTFSGCNARQLFYRSWYPAATKAAMAKSANGTAMPCNGIAKPANSMAKACNDIALPLDSSALDSVAFNSAVLDSATQDPSVSARCSSAVEFPSVPVKTSGTGLKGVLALVHGLGEHSGRYCPMAQVLTDAGYAVFAFDNQGHGQSEGQRGHIESWQDYRDNLGAFLQLVRQQEPTAPLFLMGHSLGGLIVLDYVLHQQTSLQFQALQIRGLIVSAPPIHPANNTASSLRAMLARLLSGLLPSLTLNMGLAKDGLSRNPDIINEVARDPLVHSCVTLRWGSETLNTIAWVKSHINELRLPILITHGDADPIIAPEGSREIFERIQSPNKTLTLYPGSYHEPHNDLDAAMVVSDLVNWLNSSLLTQKQV
jgi:alpha-beta hydrolase superfamily lysophospholipase